MRNKHQLVVLLVLHPQSWAQLWGCFLCQFPSKNPVAAIGLIHLNITGVVPNVTGKELLLKKERLDMVEGFDHRTSKIDTWYLLYQFGVKIKSKAGITEFWCG